MRDLTGAGIFDPISAAFSACKRQTHPIDVASVLQPPSSRWGGRSRPQSLDRLHRVQGECVLVCWSATLRYYLILSLAYGMMANLDIGTEHLR